MLTQDSSTQTENRTYDVYIQSKDNKYFNKIFDWKMWYLNLMIMNMSVLIICDNIRDK